MTLVALLLLQLGSASTAPVWEPLPFPRALVWGVVPKAFDLYTTAVCIERNPRCRELNPLQPSAEHRAALGLAVSVVAAEGFYYMESERGLRLWPMRVRVRSRIPRYLWAAAHIGLGVHNLVQARRK